MRVLEAQVPQELRRPAPAAPRAAVRDDRHGFLIEIEARGPQLGLELLQSGLVLALLQAVHVQRHVHLERLEGLETWV